MVNGFALNKIDCENVYRKIAFSSGSKFKVNTAFDIKPDPKAAFALNAMFNMWSGEFVKFSNRIKSLFLHFV